MEGPGCLQELTLEITRECVNRCLHCSSMAVPAAGGTPADATAIRRLAAEAAELGLRSLAISGGEPFLHPQFQ